MLSSVARLAKVSIRCLCCAPSLARPPRPAASRAEFKADAHASAFRPSKANLGHPRARPRAAPGAQVLKYKFGPLKIQPGQNLIDIDIQKERPNVDGWIVGFRPGLVDAKTGKNPPVTEVHLHHAVWLSTFKPTFAAGEEKTNFNAPRPATAGATRRSRPGCINHMIHDLVGQPHEVYITYTLYFIPDTAPQAAGIHEIDTQWMDVKGIKPYPVFNALQGLGHGRQVHLPRPGQEPVPGPPGTRATSGSPTATRRSSPTAGHLHPGGLWTDLDVTRDGKTVRLFRSRANYYDPSGAVSWDVAMSATAPDWRVHVRKGDVLASTRPTTRPRRRGTRSWGS